MPVTVNTGACSVDTNSNSATSVVFNGHPHLTSYTIVTSGNYSVGGATVTLTTPATINAPTTTDPYANGIHPVPAPCLPGTSITTPTLPANNGCYSSVSITGNAVLPSNSVFYVSGGLFSISGNGTVTGNQVTVILFKNASVSITGGPNVTLTAPTAGASKGILFWQNKASTSCPPCTADTISGGAATALTGALYFPHGNVDFGGNNTSNCTVLIANTVTFHGTPNSERRWLCCGRCHAPVMGVERSRSSNEKDHARQILAALRLRAPPTGPAALAGIGCALVCFYKAGVLPRCRSAGRPAGRR